MDKYPKVRQFLQSNPFDHDHAAAGFDISHPIVPALEYFLSLGNVSGYEQKLNDIRQKPRGTCKTNERTIQWASLCAEINAVCLLGKFMGFEILGLEQSAHTTSRKTCDIKARRGNTEMFFEVKRNSSEEKQTLPDYLTQSLLYCESNISYKMIPELLNRNYDCCDIDILLHQIKNHVDEFKKQKRQSNMQPRSEPSDFTCNAFKIMFFEKSDIECSGHFFAPISIRDLQQYLLGPSPNHNMVPMVQQSIIKGADFLICCVSGWDDWREIVTGCFADVARKNSRTYFSPDPKLGSLCGIILFARHDDFCIINNKRADNTKWIEA